MRIMWPRRSRSCLASKWGWSRETQRLALLHVVDPAARFEPAFEAKLRMFYEAKP
jgi:hypothetical protein